MKTSHHNPAILYTANNCPYCRQARGFLIRHGIPFLEYNVNRSPKAMKQLQRLGVRGIPVLRRDEHILVGFDLNRWTKRLIG